MSRLGLWMLLLLLLLGGGRGDGASDGYRGTDPAVKWMCGSRRRHWEKSYSESSSSKLSVISMSCGYNDSIWVGERSGKSSWLQRKEINLRSLCESEAMAKVKGPWSK